MDDYGWALCVRDRKENVDQLRAAVEMLAEEARQVTRECRRRRLMLRVSRLRWRLLEAEWLEAYNWENGEAALIRAIEPIPPEQFEAYRTGLGIPLLVLWNARRRSS